MNIRLAGPEDAPALLAIYEPYVRSTPITFEYTVPSPEEFADRITRTLERYPYLVAEEDGLPVGYAYASRFKVRAAYDWSVETTIYIDQEKRGRGAGRALYTALERCLAVQNVCNLCACIAWPNPASVALHESLGYRINARFTASGYKNGKWYDMIWMEKTLTPHEIPPRPFIPYPETPDFAARAAGKESL